MQPLEISLHRSDCILRPNPVWISGNQPGRDTRIPPNAISFSFFFRTALRKENRTLFVFIPMLNTVSNTGPDPCRRANRRNRLRNLHRAPSEFDNRVVVCTLGCKTQRNRAYLAIELDFCISRTVHRSRLLCDSLDCGLWRR